MFAIGRPLKRLEDRVLLTSEGRFAADFAAQDQIFMRMVRSPVAFGRLKSVDISEAVKLTGVMGVWTASDVEGLPPIDFRMTKISGLEPYRQYVLARNFVRYVGEPVAVVFATDPYLAEDAAELVFCDIEELNPVLNPTASPVAFEPGGSPEFDTEPATITKQYGDLAAAFSNAYDVVELEVKVGRHSGVPLETRGAFSTYDEATDTLVMHGAAKVPHYNRDAIARMLGRAPERVQLKEGHVGGGFGVRGELYPEDVLVCAAALKFRRPVKWTEDRKEHLLSANHSRDQVHRMRAAIDETGLFWG